MNSSARIWFDTPAEKWDEALPTGNGRLGGMVFGKPYVEYIQLNEDSVWSGGPTDRNNPHAKEYLPEIRRLIFAGKIAEAQELCAYALSGTPETQRHYEPLANLYLHFSGDKKAINDYRRELDLATGVITISFKKSGVTYIREVFTSYPHGVMVIRLTTDKPGTLSFHTQLARGNPTWDYQPYQNQINRNGGYNACADKSYTIAPDISVMTSRCNGDGSLAAAIKVINDGGIVRNIGNSIIVRDATEVLILLAANTTFRTDNPEEATLLDLDKFATDYRELYEAHLRDYTGLYNRVSLNLSEEIADQVRNDVNSPSLPTPKRLENFRNNGNDNSLIELMFNFGRYLLISCSRPGSLPANLQGLWNDSFFPAWDSKYTININTQMNYWPAEVCNLSECHLPLFDHIKRMQENGRKTAKVMYGCKGFVAHHNTDIWGDTAPQDACLSASYWVMGAAWLCLHIWEHYQFNNDNKFLGEYYPLMRDAAEFILDFLVEDGDKLVICPTLSPENEYRLPNRETGVICKGAAMDNQIIFELFNACIKASRVLGIDNDFSGKLSDTLTKIAGINIGKLRQVMEWNEDYEEIDPGHRHISHLFALHPGTQIDAAKIPALAIAARKTLERRLAGGGGHTGWSRAWIINMWARLHLGDKALLNVKELLKSSTLPNLFDNHPPFQIDGNFGFTAGIAEMLLQSHNDVLRLLPALPIEWRNGCVKGLRARGGFTVNIKWQNGNLTQAEITTLSDCEVMIVYGDKNIPAKLSEGINTIQF